MAKVMNYPLIDELVNYVLIYKIAFINMMGCI